MSLSARARLVRSAAAALLAGALGGGCGNSPPTDRNFGTNLGADFRAPIVDAGSDGDTNVTPDASVDSTGGTTGVGGATGTGGAIDTGGGTGTGGATGAAGNGGTAGAGS